MPPLGRFVYVAIGPTLTAYRLDRDGATLNSEGSTRLPAAVQYAQPSASGRTLYVASSDGGPGGGGAGGHHLSALCIDPGTGSLTPHGDPVALPARPIHVGVDPTSEHVLVAFNSPPALRVYRVAPDETLAGPVDELGAGDLGIYPHQVRVTPDGRRVIVVCRGNDGTAEQPEQPGSLRVFAYEGGRLGAQSVVAPGGGYGFGPRDVDFHPRHPWLYVSLERQNELAMFAWTGRGDLEGEPRRRVSTLAVAPRGHQLAGPVHVHPRGHVAYVVNRVPASRTVSDPSLYRDADNTMAVYSLDPGTGEPSLLQHVDTGGLHCRTFQIDPAGTLLIAAHTSPMPVDGGGSQRAIPAGLSLFRIADDGRLALLRRHPEDVGPHQLFWMGLVAGGGDEGVAGPGGRRR